MTVTINGTETEVAQGTTVLAFLEAKGLSPDVVVVELNGDILPGESFGKAALAQGDTVEILRFVGGG